MKLNIDIVDAFTSTQFGGNSAAVIITDTWLTENLMQAIAVENNLSETAFLVPVETGIYDIRWFIFSLRIEIMCNMVIFHS